MTIRRLAIAAAIVVAAAAGYWGGRIVPLMCALPLWVGASPVPKKHAMGKGV
jgi:hypothetical protein